MSGVGGGQSAEITRLAAILAEHQWSPSRNSCWCGWTPTDAVMALSSTEDQFFNHQAAACVTSPGQAPQ